MTRSRWLPLVAVLLVPAGAAAGQPAETVPPPQASGTARPSAADAPSADAAYALGYRIGGRIVADHEEMGIALDRAALAKGLADAVGGAKPALDDAAFARALAAFEAVAAQRQADFARRMEEAARTNLTKGREFMAANAKRPGVIVRPSGLQYEVITAGQGPVPKADDVVTAHYRGTHIDGREFDATDPAGEPATFPLRGVVPGWREALPLMKAGSKWRLWIPAELAYGAEGSPPVIEPNEVLVFEIELVRSGPAAAPPRR
jgi:FKBP-type peptidyl-prolyl cis-trans isomerase